MRCMFLVPPSLDGLPPADRLAGCARALYPLINVFELTSASCVRENGFTVSYENFPISGGDEKTFRNFIKKDESDVYAIYGVNLTKETDIKAAKIIFEERKDSKVIFYGPAPTYYTNEYLFNENAFVVRGEPEITLSSLISTISNNKDLSLVSGVSYKDNNSVIVSNKSRNLITDLDELPYQAIDLIKDNKAYANPKLGIKPVATMLTSRNCPYKCVYCVPCSHSFARELEYKKEHHKKPPVYYRSPKNVAGEIEILAQKGYKAITFIDDLFIIGGTDRILEICEALGKHSMVWGCATRVDTIKEKVVKAMAKSGCKYIDLGIESFNEDILKDIRKDMDVSLIEPTIKMIKKYGIKAKVNVLLGASALESRETILYSQRQVKYLDADQVMYNIANPFPGTEFYDIAKREGYFIKGDYYPSDVQKESLINLPKIKGDELISLVKKGNREFFLNPKFILKNIWRFATPKDFLDALKALWKKLS